MKNWMVLLAILLLGYDVQANHFDKGSKVYVTAPSGLNMRVSPTMEGKVLYYLEYGEEVDVIEYVSDGSLRIDWIDGYWVKVHYEGVEGYVFDGYLSNFPTPVYDSEFTNIDLDFVYPTEAYFTNHFGHSKTTDTLVSGDYSSKIVEKLSSNIRIVKTQKPGFYKLEVYLDDYRLMDVYNLLMGMLSSKSEYSEYKNKSVFFENHYGTLNKIKINTEHPVEIRKLKSGQVKITAYSYYDGC